MMVLDALCLSIRVKAIQQSSGIWPWGWGAGSAAKGPTHAELRFQHRGPDQSTQPRADPEFMGHEAYNMSGTFSKGKNARLGKGLGKAWVRSPEASASQ